MYESGLGLRLGLYPGATEGLVLSSGGKETRVLEPSWNHGGANDPKSTLSKREIKCHLHYERGRWQGICLQEAYSFEETSSVTVSI